MKHKQQGLTLIEILVSLIIVLLISALSMQVIPISKINRDSTADQALTLQVKAYMEDLAFRLQDKLTFEDTALPVSSLTSGIYTCTASSSNPDSSVSPTLTLRKRVVLTCTASGKPNLVFATEFGRPE